MTVEFPRPDTVSERDRTFWSAAAEGRLLIQECPACGHRQFYPRPGCTACGADDPGWLEADGTATVYAHTVIRRATEHPTFEADVPYVVAYVALDEGPLMYTNVVDCEPEDVENGMAVEVTFDRVEDDLAIPKFKPR